MISQEDTIFLRWFINRLVFRYGVNNTDSNFQRFYAILNRIQGPQSITISQDDLDKIIAKYYADFYLDRSENMGFTNDERNKLREQILDMAHDLLNKNIPHNTQFFITN